MWGRKKSTQAQPPAIKYTGHVGSMSPHHLEVLEQFRTELQNEGVLDPEKHDDYFLTRFLRARKYVLAKAKEMFINYINWRRTTGVDEIVRNFDFPQLDEVKRCYPHTHHKVDKFGRPIYIEQIGRLDIKKLFEVTTPEQMLNYFVWSYERMLTTKFPACSQVAQRRIETSLTILDLNGASTKLWSSKVYNFVKSASSIAQDYYPEMLGKMFIVNAPMLFSGIWNLIKPMLDEKTRNKITIVGSGYKDKLLALVDAENLPDFLGGTCTCEGGCMMRDVGPWNDPSVGKPISVAAEELEEEIKHDH
eukprot:GILI01001849.1.p1 GENE.GILI01001849.1~~GILI01001849.1.p1  ORF type:complete len:305 (+),score=85.90 GILI01001849.1:103-1017(+)